MTVKVSNIKIPIETTEDELYELAAKKIGVKKSDCLSFRIARQAVDARKKQVHFVCSVNITLKKGARFLSSNDVAEICEKEEIPVSMGDKSISAPPVIVGMGPAGLFCALTLARHGYKPIVLERGGDVESRIKHVKNFWENGILNTSSNVQFGEGGAGTFSDGKLTTRINDPLCERVLRDFVKYGADESILFKAKPHIGTDVLSEVVKNIRNEIIALGATVKFNTQLSDIKTDGNKIKSIITKKGETLACDLLVIALGHSARDTYKMLLDRGIDMVLKPFSVGVRIEHAREDIDKSMYGDYAGNPLLGAADYALSYKNGDDRCYSFCMCPGGYVVAAASEENTVVTNGMSNSTRDFVNSNAALCVNVSEKDFGSLNPLAGIEYQRMLEKAAFASGGKNYHAPMQTVGDFLKTSDSLGFARITPSYTGGITETDLRTCLPENICRTLSDALCFFGKKIHGFNSCNALLTGVETRTSAPVRIVRNENLQSVSCSGLYPCGEGAGYAGGIMSAAVDGIRIAEKIISEYKM